MTNSAPRAHTGDLYKPKAVSAPVSQRLFYAQTLKRPSLSSFNPLNMRIKKETAVTISLGLDPQVSDTREGPADSFGSVEVLGGFFMPPKYLSRRLKNG